MGDRVIIVRLFGHAAIEHNGDVQPLAVPPKAVVLLALLLAGADRPINREWLAERLWPDEDLTGARTNLRRHVHLLTKVLGDDALVLTRHTAQWNASSPVRADVVEFNRLRSTQPAAAAALYEGDLCEGVSDPSLDDLRERYRSRYESTLRDLARAARTAGDDAALLMWLARLTAHDPFDEETIRELMTARHRCGDRPGALRAYSGLCARLRSELEVEPQAETVSLFQTIAADNAQPPTPNNLPANSTSFVGRERELQLIASMMRETRCTTITGAGGIGKTRLAVRAASCLLPAFRDGVWFIPLAAAASIADVYRSICRELGVNPGREDPGASVLRRLRSRRELLILDNCEHIIESAAVAAQAIVDETAAHVLVTSRRRLGIADEHVIDLRALETPAGTGVESPEMLLRSPAVRLFLERAVSAAPWLKLTHENGRPFSEIVRRLDGLPLAMEIVAARANLLTIEGIAKRLSDSLSGFKTHAPDRRHETIEAAIAWSYDLLSEPERTVLRRCAVFHARWDSAAADAVLSVDCTDAFEAVSELVESSLVQTERHADDIKYSLLETTRAFARRKLIDCGELDAVSRVHAEYFARAAEGLCALFETPREDEYFRALDEMHGDLIDAFGFSVTAQPEVGAAIVGAAFRYWVYRGRAHEMTPVVERFSSSREFAHVGVALRAKVHLALGAFYREADEIEQAHSQLEIALSECREAGDRAVEAAALNSRAILYYNTGRSDQAREEFTRLLPLQKALGNEVAHAMTLANLGSVAHRLSDLDEAQRYYDLALPEYRRLNHSRGLAHLYRQLALISHSRERLDDALEYSRASLEMSRQTGEAVREADAWCMYGNTLRLLDRYGEAFEAYVNALEILERAESAQFLMLTVQGLADATAELDPAESARLHSFAAAMRDRAGTVLGDEYRELVQNTTAGVRERLGEDRFADAWAAGRSMEAGDALATARRLAASDAVRTITR